MGTWTWERATKEAMNASVEGSGGRLSAGSMGGVEGGVG